jgi:hypothetical protein
LKENNPVKDDSMNSVAQILQQMATQTPLPKPQRQFINTLLCTLMIVRGKVNFTNLSRYCALSERTLRRQFRTEFDWLTFNRLTVAQVVPDSATQIVAMDASFIKKSGKKTYGLDWFFNGCANRPEKGLEVSLISVIDVDANTAYALAVRQTPTAPSPETQGAQGAQGAKTAKQTKTVRQTKKAQGPAAETRLDLYLQHLQEAQPALPAGVRYGVFDGAYARKKFVDGVCALGAGKRKLHVVSKLRGDADLRYLYEGPQKARGAKRKYDGKVNFNDLRRWQDLGAVEEHLHLYSAVLYHVSLKRVIRVVLLLCTKDPTKPRYVLLFSSDVELAGVDIYRLYKARFQIEFLFRDAKQWTGLCDCQARDAKALHYHFNAALSSVNIVKLQAWQRHQAAPHPSAPAQGKQAPFVFSLGSWKQRAFNEHLLETIIDHLGLEPSWLKSHPCYDSLRNYGAIAP